MQPSIVLMVNFIALFQQRTKRHKDLLLLPPGYIQSGSMYRPVIVSDVLIEPSIIWFLLRQLIISTA